MTGTVKALEWRPYRNGDADAVTPFGIIYSAYASGFWRTNKDPKFKKGGNNLSEAQAAAQADFEKDVLSVLTASASEQTKCQCMFPRDCTCDPVPTPDGAVEAMRRAKQTLERYHRAGLGDEVFHADLTDTLRIVSAALSHPADGWRATHRHVKRGTEYTLLGIGKMQAEKWQERLGGGFSDSDPPRAYADIALVDMREVAIYRSVDDGSLWVRPREEFEDGRFELLAANPEGRT